MISANAVAAEPWPTPRAMTRKDIDANVAAWASAARRAVAAGFEIIEIHGAHGYLIHQFLASASNFRNDEYGGSLEKRMRFALEVTAAVRAAIPPEMHLFFRVSAVDGSGAGWSVDDSVELAKRLRSAAWMSSTARPAA